MKKKQSINHFTGREQQALLQLKNKIVTLYKPLIVYLIGCKSSSQLNRNCMVKPGTEEQWIFSCDLLMVLPEGASLPENAVQELKSMNRAYGNIRLMAHPFDFVAMQLKECALFFCWLQGRGIVLYEKDNSCEKLPEPVVNLKQYENQVHQFFTDNVAYKGYTEVKLLPLPQKPVQKDESPALCEQHILSSALQNKMVDFLKTHGAKTANLHLREAMFEYVTSVTETGISKNFHDILWVFEDLMKFFDLAEMVVTVNPCSTTSSKSLIES